MYYVVVLLDGNQDKTGASGVVAAREVVVNGLCNPDATDEAGDFWRRRQSLESNHVDSMSDP